MRIFLRPLFFVFDSQARFRKASQEPRAGHWALAGQDAQRSQQPGKPQRELPAHPLAATMGSGPKSRGAIHGAMRSGGGGGGGR